MKTRKPIGSRVGTPAKIIAVTCCAMLALAILYLMWPTGAKKSPDASIDSALRVNDLTLTLEYAHNEVAADQKYKGKKLEVECTLQQIRKGPLGGIHITDERVLVIQFSFDPERADEVASLGVGDRARIRGTCRGLTLGELHFDECEVDKSYQEEQARAMKASKDQANRHQEEICEKYLMENGFKPRASRSQADEEAAVRFLREHGFALPDSISHK
jgi:hypothetical protein